MPDKLDNALRFQQESLSLLNRRQNILASNIANADTPGYLARDIDFASTLNDAINKTSSISGPLSLSLTSGKHIKAQANNFSDAELLYRIPDQPAADGNTVDMDRERSNLADNTIRYQSSLTFVGMQIKNMMTVISQG